VDVWINRVYRLLEIIQYTPFQPDADIESGVPSHTDAIAALAVRVCDTLTTIEGYKEFILFRFPFATCTASQTSHETAILKETQTEKGDESVDSYCRDGCLG